MKQSPKQTLVLLDAHAIIHRAYHALPSFTNTAGVPTGALYGLTTMLIRIIEELKPQFIVAAYDLPKPTFRHHAYDAYKGGRAKTDDDLVAQLIASREIFAAFNIPCIDAEGFEADDIIGTLVEQFRTTPDLSIIIASGDMDTLQLIDGKKIQVFTLKRGVNDTILYDEKGVIERYGFLPKQLVDYKGLRGDPSDNIIGVAGIGEKTATAIIQTFSSIEGLYEALEADPTAGKKAGLTDRIVRVLLDHKDDAFFSKMLATIRRDAPITYTLPTVEYRASVDQEKIMEIVTRYEFRSVLSRIQKIFSFTTEVSHEAVDPMLLRKASIALWVLYSEHTNPPYEAILERTKKKQLDEAYDVLILELKKRALFDVYEKIELPLLPIIEQMQSHGIGIDRQYFSDLRDRMTAQLKRIETEVHNQTGTAVNLNSPKQLSELLFTKLGLKTKTKRKASGAFTTNAETLESLRDEHPIIALILEHREIQKLLSTYVEALLSCAGEDDRVHATFLQHGTTTGRFSSVNPNLQNIPIKGEGGKDIRHGFVAAKGYTFVSSDYSQIELRVLALLSGDEHLIDSFNQGNDIHATVAAKMFGVAIDDVTNDMRRKAKVINFGILYGMGVTALQKNLGSTRAEAQTFYDQYFASFPRIAAYLEKTKEYARAHGYTETLFGRRRYFPSINASAGFLKAIAERTAVNAPIQGTNADIVKIAIALIDEDIHKEGLHEKVHLILQIHDELVYEVADDILERAEAIIEDAMKQVFDRSPIPLAPCSVPLTVSLAHGKRLDDLT